MVQNSTELEKTFTRQTGKHYFILLQIFQTNVTVLFPEFSYIFLNTVKKQQQNVNVTENANLLEKKYFTFLYFLHNE